jgi:polysaccharide export outer membrane protein
VKRSAIILLSLLLVICVASQTAYGDGEYRLGPGDVLRISVFGYPDMTLEAVVSPDGTVSTAFDSVEVGGLTLKESVTTIRELYAEYIRDPKVSVNVKEYRTGRVKVLGGVMKPAIYTFPAYKSPTAGEVIAMAGGFSDKADSKTIYVIKENSQDSAMMVKSFHDLLMDKGEDPLLSDGDVVYVPEREGGVLVLGEVARPGQYPLVRDMKVMDAIAQAGGPKEGARVDRASLTRDMNGTREVMDIPLDKLLVANNSQGNILLRDGDMIYIPADNRVTVSEAVTILSAVKLMKDILGW